jgi:hypothetical protein
MDIDIDMLMLSSGLQNNTIISLSILLFYSSSKSNDKKEKIDWPNGIKEELPPSSAGYQNCKNMHSNSKEEAKRRGKSQHIRKSTYSTH